MRNDGKSKGSKSVLSLSVLTQQRLNGETNSHLKTVNSLAACVYACERACVSWCVSVSEGICAIRVGVDTTKSTDTSQFQIAGLSSNQTFLLSLSHRPVLPRKINKHGTHSQNHNAFC